MLTKKLTALALVLMLLLAFTGCGGNKQALVGTWQLADTESDAEYGVGLEFKKDGTMTYGITADMLSQLGDAEMTQSEWDDAMEGMGYLMKIEYKVKSDTEMEIKVSAMMGLASEKTTVPYSLSGDTLTFDGSTYTRVK